MTKRAGLRIRLMSDTHDGRHGRMFVREPVRREERIVLMLRGESGFRSCNVFEDFGLFRRRRGLGMFRRSDGEGPGRRRIVRNGGERRRCTERDDAYKTQETL